VPDPWTNITISARNTPTLTNTFGVLDAAGKASAALNVPIVTASSAIGLRFHHAYVVYDVAGIFYMASNHVELTLVR
jgi:hypothetical protein